MGQLIPGCVICLEVVLSQTTKPKCCVCVGSDGEELVSVVNSDISRFIQARANLLPCQVTIDGKSHPYLRKDSHERVMKSIVSLGAKYTMRARGIVRRTCYAARGARRIRRGSPRQMLGEVIA